MSGSDNNESWKFDLDAKAMIEALDGIKGKIISIGDEENLAGLVRGFLKVAGPIAAAGVALFAFKKSLDLTLEGEQIEKIHNQFVALSDAAGVSHEKLQSDLEKSIGKTITLNDALQSVNKTLTTLGAGTAQHIPEYFELARKVVKVYGGEVTERFEQISQAVATGNTRYLRHIGLTTDAEKAMRKYAASINENVHSLSEQGRQMAISDAILAKANTKFKDISAGSDTTGGSLKELSAAFKELGEWVATRFYKIFGPTFQTLFQGATAAVTQFTHFMKSAMGDVPEVDKLESKIKSLEMTLWTWRDATDAHKAESSIFQKLTTDLEAAKKRLMELKDEQSKAAATTEDKSPEEIANLSRDNEKKAKLNSEFQKDLLQMKQARLQAEQNIEDDADIYRETRREQEMTMIEQYDQKINDLKAKTALSEGFSAEQNAQLIEQIEAEKQAKLADFRRDEENDVLKSYDNQVRAARTASEGMAAGFVEGSAKAKKANADYGEQGRKTFESVGKNAVNAFKAMGDGSKDAGEAIKGFLLNSVADYFEMKGEGMLLEGIWPPNPAAIAAGGGLIALSAAMRAAAGGGGGGGSSGGGSGGGGAAAGYTAPAYNGGKPEPDEQKKKAVTFQFEGHYFETEQTQRRLLELMRQETDATDFRYQQIGVT